VAPKRARFLEKKYHSVRGGGWRGGKDPGSPYHRREKKNIKRKRRGDNANHPIPGVQKRSRGRKRFLIPAEDEERREKSSLSCTLIESF